MRICIASQMPFLICRRLSAFCPPDPFTGGKAPGPNWGSQAPRTVESKKFLILYYAK